MKIGACNVSGSLVNQGMIRLRIWIKIVKGNNLILVDRFERLEIFFPNSFKFRIML